MNFEDDHPSAILPDFTSNLLSTFRHEGLGRHFPWVTCDELIKAVATIIVGRLGDAGYNKQPFH